MKTYRITKGILDELFSNDLGYMNELAKLNVMDTKDIYDRLKNKRASLMATAVLGLVHEINARMPEGYTADYTQIKRWLKSRCPWDTMGLRVTIEYLDYYRTNEMV